ncbi:A49-like RNA polymerase I associated factor [Rhizodiscina lignyota]|uniref:A49-like RNA polymerase I associated factor n=1 Tax=Rhizodiscina lignyota TaxID=1504668 RepID=A0A9P4I785_9PEZI|nr:A49-like RNA polymerase I associated factor [Rhizodiscina lignyota]
MPEKKRKRANEHDGRNAKKVASAPDSANLKVSLLRESGELCPVIASSPGLSFPSDISLKAYKKRDSTVPIPGRPAPEGKPYELLLQSSDHPRLDYEAHQEQDGANGLLQHYIGVYDPKTGDLKLMEARKLVLRTTLRPEEGSEDEMEEPRQTNASLRQNLGMEFGTKKAKKAIASLTVNAISPAKGTGDGKPKDAATKALLNSIAASTVDMPSRRDLQASVDDAKPRPKANLSATAVRDVYPLVSLIGPEELKNLPVKEWIDAVKEKQDVLTRSRYVARRLQQTARDDDNQDRVKALRYLTVLIELYAAGKPSRGGGKKLPPRDALNKRLGVDEALVSSVVRKFADGGDMTKWKVDNLVTHICALALIVDNFESDVNDIREDLSLDNKQITQYFHEIGCTITAPTERERERTKITKAEAFNHRMARLRIPLDFPKQRVMAQRRR